MSTAACVSFRASSEASPAPNACPRGARAPEKHRPTRRLARSSSRRSASRGRATRCRASEGRAHDGVDDMSSLAARFAGAKAVLWDVDGTLADSTSLGFTSTNAVLVEAGLPTIDLAQYKRGTRYPTPERMAWHAAGTPSDPVGASLGARFDEHYVRLVDTRTAGFYAGVAELVRALHDAKSGRQAVLSNACGAYARRVVDANDARAFFKSVHGADDAPAPKPSPDGLLAIARENGWDAGTCVYVGDSPSDGAAARAAGMMSVGCAWGAHDETELRRGACFDVIVRTVAELREALLA